MRCVVHYILASLIVHIHISPIHSRTLIHIPLYRELPPLVLLSLRQHPHIPRVPFTVSTCDRAVCLSLSVLAMTWMESSGCGASSLIEWHLCLLSFYTFNFCCCLADVLLCVLCSLCSRRIWSICLFFSSCLSNLFAACPACACRECMSLYSVLLLLFVQKEKNGETLEDLQFKTGLEMVENSI